MTIAERGINGNRSFEALGITDPSPTYSQSKPPVHNPSLHPQTSLKSELGEPKSRTDPSSRRERSKERSKDRNRKPSLSFLAQRERFRAAQLGQKKRRTVSVNLGLMSEYAIFY